MDSFSKLPSSKQAIIKKCLLFGSENADNKLLHDSSIKKNQLHGFRNYILFLNALWLYARKISVNKQTDAKCRAQILNELMVKDSKEKEFLDLLLRTVPEIYTLYRQKYGSNPTNFEKQYLVLGLALHLIGDIYAHRTLITVQAVDQLIGDGTLKKKDFKDYKEFLDKIRKGKIQCADFNKELKNNAGNPALFEDNTAFMPNRYKYSKKTAKSFISNYVISGSNFKAEYIKQNASDGITLKNFDKYI